MAKCMFCQERTANSREHLYGDWWGKHAGVIRDDQLASIHLVGSTAPGESYELRTGPVGSTASADRAKIRIVCSVCNNEWMSRIEDAMSQAFPRVYYGAPENIDTGDRTTIREWMFLKGCLRENASRGSRKEMQEKERSGTDDERVIAGYQKRVWNEFCLNRAMPNLLQTYIYRSDHSKDPRCNFLRMHSFWDDKRRDHDDVIDWRYFHINISDFGAIQTNFSGLIEELYRKCPSQFVLLEREGNVSLPNVKINREELESNLYEILKRYGSKSTDPQVALSNPRYLIKQNGLHGDP